MDPDMMNPADDVMAQDGDVTEEAMEGADEMAEVELDGEEAFDNSDAE